jgi:bifunctional DNA-binding transcriptional regulator/antitoxin component of YhaV-PrlF toxin-antitoxin module
VRSTTESAQPLPLVAPRRGVSVNVAIIAPVVPPAVAQGRDRAVGGAAGGVPSSGRPLPLPRLIVQRTSVYVYGLAALDDRGRLGDRSVVRALGWSAGFGVDIGEAAGVLIVHARAKGEFRVSGQGHLRLPAVIRHRCGLAPGDRVLLAADPGQRQLVIYPPAVLDEFTAQHQRMAGGESA